MKYFSIIFSFIFLNIFGQNHKADTQLLPTEVPFTISNNLIILKGKVNGTDVNILWDNGFSFCGIDEELLHQLQLKKEKKEKTATDGTGEELNIGFTTLPTLSIGQLQKSKVKAIIFQSSVIPSTIKIDAVLGAEVINQFIWDFDFDTQILTVSNKEIPKKIVQETPFQIDKKSHLHYLPLLLNDRKTLIHSDFGSNSENLDVIPEFADIVFGKDIPRLTLEGWGSISISGKIENSTSYLLKNEYDLSTSETELSRSYAPLVSVSDKLQYEAVLGNYFFRNLGNLIINPKEKKYKLYSSKREPIPYHFSNFGFACTIYNGQIQVIRMIKESANVKKHNISLGDVIESIDGHTMDFFKDNDELSEYLHEKESIQFIFKDKGPLNLTKEKFF
ncbi:aspartyl protease family protein [Chryseobacterium sp. CT-SW4]|uniref:aspartyl protease family protein n=1 Tax=Chryseobacterium sp. SW-1 TaxID=3157343 RepID=UPI003B02EA29